MLFQIGCLSLHLCRTSRSDVGAEMGRGAEKGTVLLSRGNHVQIHMCCAAKRANTWRQLGKVSGNREHTPDLMLLFVHGSYAED